MQLRTIFMAVDFEAEEVFKRHNYALVNSEPFQVWQNDVSRLIITGIGLVPAATAFAWAVSKFDFDEAINIGSAGASSAVKCVVQEYDEEARFDITRGDQDKNKDEVVFANAYEVSVVSSIEPYSDFVFEVSQAGRKLVTSSRPVLTRKQRDEAAAKGDLVDMEGYALAMSAKVFSKKLSIIKIVSDFSEQCDIHRNILSLQRRLANIKGVFD